MTYRHKNRFTDTMKLWLRTMIKPGEKTWVYAPTGETGLKVITPKFLTTFPEMMTVYPWPDHISLNAAISNYLTRAEDGPHYPPMRKIAASGSVKTTASSSGAISETERRFRRLTREYFGSLASERKVNEVAAAFVRAIGTKTVKALA